MDKDDFINEYHAKKELKFEPPTWEEFLATRTEHSFAHWFCGDIGIVMVEKNNEKGILKTYNQFEVSLFEDYHNLSKRFDYAFIESYGIDYREDVYYEALEYAKKLFLEGVK